MKILNSLKVFIDLTFIDYGWKFKFSNFILRMSWFNIYIKDWSYQRNFRLNN